MEFMQIACRLCPFSVTILEILFATFLSLRLVAQAYEFYQLRATIFNLPVAITLN